ncbi:MAG: hypothetical protein PHY34_00315 [Patescibacteria group bacterium]|nr:hypothetical protein [Patescibacteria group bacterium]MDD5715924.1 hypothetical protein [Patescibacteria group bacterium]
MNVRSAVRRIAVACLPCLMAVIISGCGSKTAAPTAANQTNAARESEAGWQEHGAAITGEYADAEITPLGDGRYRMYYSAEPETAGFQGQVYSSVSTDGIRWAQEEGVRKSWAIFPDIITLADGTYRIYFQNAGSIKSALSTDGMTWADEDGVRIDTSETGYALDTVGAQTTTRLADGTYVMVYRGTINEKYQTTEEIPNSTTQLFFWATSADGLTFEKKGVAIDSRNETLYGLADGAEWATWDNAELRLYFWSYAGVFHVVFSNGVFSEPVFDWTNNTDSRAKFAPNPPCDPTFAKINGTWYMYYGQHAKGVYYATFQ